jgi:hypothetical protein
MLTVYLDESGHETGEHVAVAGFMRADEQWAAFDPAWLAALKGHPSFHAHSLRWNQERTKNRIEKLSVIPYQHGPRSIAGSVCVSDYADLLQNKAEEYVSIRDTSYAFTPSFPRFLSKSLRTRRSDGY